MNRDSRAGVQFAHQCGIALLRSEGRQNCYQKKDAQNDLETARGCGSGHRFHWQRKLFSIHGCCNSICRSQAVYPSFG